MTDDWRSWFALGAVAGAIAGFFLALWTMRTACRIAIRFGIFHAPRNCPIAKAAWDSRKARGDV